MMIAQYFQTFRPGGGANSKNRNPSAQPNACWSRSHSASLVNQWYPAKGPSGDGANTKSNYKDGWHHSA